MGICCQIPIPEPINYRSDEMITNTKQDWSIGKLVNVGFLKSLKVISWRAEYDGLPDIYTLESKNGNLYEFTPHNGLVRIN